MATNEIFKLGQYLDYAVGEVRSGTPVLIGMLNGVALTDSGGSTSAVDGRPSGGVGNKEGRASVAHVGAFSVPVEGSEGVVGVGMAVYWNQNLDGLTLDGSNSVAIFGAVAPAKTNKPGHLVVHVSQFTLPV